MTGLPFRGFPIGRLFWWMLGITGAAALLLGLYPLVASIALAQGAANHVDDREEAEAAQSRRWAAEARSRLLVAVADGELTDLEINDAAGRRWSVVRTSSQIRVTTGYPAGLLSADCYAVVVSLPLGPASVALLTTTTPCPTGPAVAPSATSQG